MKARIPARSAQFLSRAPETPQHFSPVKIQEQQNNKHNGFHTGLEQITPSGHSLKHISILSPGRAPVSQTQPEAAAPQEHITPEKSIPQQRPVEPAHHGRNNTGLPDRLKMGIENLTGLPLDDVRVHYHSSEPARVNALAYTQGRDIYMEAGQEKHLAHEAWHVVQQKQGHVGPTAQIRGTAINGDRALEKEADVMGERALRFQSVSQGILSQKGQKPGTGSMPSSPPGTNAVIQRLPKVSLLDATEEAQIEADISGSKFQDALDKLAATTHFAQAKPANVHSLTFDNSFADYGLAEQDRNDPKTNNEVDIKIGPPAYKDISILVSTLQHEFIHAEQYTKPSESAAGIKGSAHVYGYAKEGGSSSSKYIAAAQEVETHCWEIEHASQTNVPKDFLEGRGEALLNYWAKVHAAGTGPGVKKTSKQGSYYHELKPRVENAFYRLKSIGIDVEKTYFKHGSHYGLHIK
ncbi:MAG TPA: DUF4157 domain-containing protein [Ktedonobacteraceae bacterium]|nr:DUF4157 domain-containing protein [Ktedonobacteraceae bacterium]